MNVTEDQAKQMGCKVRNQVRIDYAPSPSDQNTNPGDDHASAVADIPAEVCEQNTNLAIFKGGYGGALSPDCPPTGGDTWCKRFRIAVQNMGPDTFNGQIKIRDLNPAHSKLSFEPSTDFACNNGTKICHTNGNVVMPTAGPTSVLVVNARLSGNNDDARALNCRVNNWARIIDPVGTSQNTQAGDDQSSFAYDLPAHLCAPPPVPVVDPVCPQGSRRIGNDCLPFIPPPPTCAYGQSLSNGHCCPTGLAWNGHRCGRHTVDPECHGHCCPSGLTWNGRRCTRHTVDEPKHCPRGTVGHWPNCHRHVPEHCPRGMSGTPPHCKRIGPTSCPSHMRGRPPHCRPIPQFNRQQRLRVPNRINRVQPLRQHRFVR